MEKRKIALFAAAWDGDVIRDTISGIKDRLEGSGMDLHVFMFFPGFGLDSPDNFGNYNICALPYYDDYEGFIFAINVVEGYDMLKKYHSKLLNCGKPMVSLEREMEGAVAVVPDGYGAEYQLVEHLIEKHGCRKINYVGGSPNHPDNILRKNAYRDALTAHGIPVEDCRIRDYHFLESDGRQAYEDFKKLGIETPDAVVCANDAMARSYCQAAEKDGKYPPEDFLIVGYDNDENSKVFTPMISTVDKNARETGYQGCEMLLRLIGKEETPALATYEQKLMLRGSCGCYAPEELVEWDNRQVRRHIYDRIKEETEYFETVNLMRQSLGFSDNEGLFNYYILSFMSRFDIYGYCMCINQEVYYGTQPTELTWIPGYDEEQYVLSGMCHGVSQEEAMIIKRRELVPEYLQQNDEKTHVYIFCALQKFGASLGYFVLVDAVNMLYRRLLVYIISAVNNSYSNLRNLENLRKMNKRLDSVYVKDALTDMYNRFGYMRDGYAMFEKSKAYGKSLMVMFMDLDRLKEINDVFGHSHGDNALILFSGVLKKCADEEKIAVRYGGDEFLIIGPVENKEEADAFKRKLEAELQHVNEESELPYRIEASIGYVLTDTKGKAELDDYVKAADEMMYEVKKLNRKNRRDYSER